LATPAMRRTAHRVSTWSGWRPVRHALTVSGIVYIALVWLRIAPYAPPIPDYGPMFDGHGYWSAWQGPMYDVPWGVNGAYVYSPAFAQLIWPLTLLPFSVFALVWTVGAIGCLFWMRVPWMIAFPGVIDDILRGNVHTFMAAAIVLSFRYPAAWLFPILTKITPGVGVLWFAARREWRNLLFATGVPAVVIGLSMLVAWPLWTQWFSFLEESTQFSAGIQLIPLPLLVRVPIAAVIAWYAGATNRAWLIPIAAMIALPNVWTSSTALLAAVPALIGAGSVVATSIGTRRQEAPEAAAA